jgi:hypothetical protein
MYQFVIFFLYIIKLVSRAKSADSNSMLLAFWSPWLHKYMRYLYFLDIYGFTASDICAEKTFGSIFLLTNFRV